MKGQGVRDPALVGAVATGDDPPGPRVCVFCGAKNGRSPRFTELARRTGDAFAKRRWTLVYGGGSVGMMGALAEGTLAAGGAAIGVIPDVLMRREVGHTGLTRLEIVADMASRKTRMIELSDAFLALPGGLGTLDELFEVLTLRQLKQHDKPIVLLSDDGYWDALVAACANGVRNGLIAAGDLAVMDVVPTLDAAIERLAAVLARPA